MFSLEDFNPLLPALRFLSCWCYIVTLAFSVLSFGIPGLMGIILCCIAFINSLTVGILGHKDKKRVQSLQTQPRPHSMVVICFDFFLVIGFLGASGLYIFNFRSTNSIYSNMNIFDAQAYIGAMAAWHFEVFFAVIGLHQWRQYRNGKAAARSFEERELRKDQAAARAVELSPTEMHNDSPPQLSA